MYRLALYDNEKHIIILVTEAFNGVDKLKEFVNTFIMSVVPTITMYIMDERNNDVGFFQEAPYGYEAIDFNGKVLCDNKRRGKDK